MNLYLIACFKQGGHRVGYRIFDADYTDNNKKFFDAGENTVKWLIKTKGVNINGIQLHRNGKLAGQNGQFDRYTQIEIQGTIQNITDQRVINQQAVVLNRVNQQDLRIVDFKGQVIDVAESQLINALETNRIGIANAKLVQRDNGTKYISSIVGQFEQINKQDNYSQTASVKQTERTAQEPAQESESLKPVNKNTGIQNTGIQSPSKEKLNKIIEINKRQIETVMSKNNIDHNAESKKFSRILIIKALETMDMEQSYLRKIIQTQNKEEDDVLNQADPLKTRAEIRDARAQLDQSWELTPLAQANLKKIRDQARADAIQRKQIQSINQNRMGNTEFNTNVPVVRAKQINQKVSDKLTQEVRYTVDGENISKTLTVDDKLSAVLQLMANECPYYFWVISGLKLVELDEVSRISTMAAQIDSIYYNPEFVNLLTVDELQFVLLHEACHVLMQHLLRGKNKVMSVFNIATDLYINKYICNEFDLDPLTKPKGQLKSAKVNNGRSSRWQAQSSVGIKVPEDCLYSPLLDCEKDTPEEIYIQIMYEMAERLKDQLSNGGQGQNQQGQNQQGQGQQSQGQSGQDQGQQGQNQQGQGGQGQQCQQGQQGQNGQGQNQGGQGQNQQGQNGQGQNQGGQGQNQQGQQGKGQQSQGQQGQNQQGQGQNQQGQDQSNIGRSDQKLQPAEIETLKRILKEKFGVDVDNKNFESDLVEDEKTVGESEQTKEQMQKSTLSGIEARLQQSGQKQYQTGLSAYMQRHIQNALAPKVNWKRALRKLVQQSKKIDYSYQKPKRQYLQQNMIFPQDVPGDPDTVGTVLIAIDTQGSISDKDIGIALKQIMNLLNKFKSKGIIMYWDTQVAAKAEFSNIQEALRLRPAGGGGTDPNCIFEDLLKDKKFQKKINKHNIEAILVFTDGYFGEIDEQYKAKFGKKTIWIINDPSYENGKWKAPFGIVAPFKDGYT